MVVTKMSYGGDNGEAVKPETQQHRQNVAETGVLLNCREERQGKMHCRSHLHEVTAEVNKQTDCNKHKAKRQKFKTCLLKINICHLQSNMHPANSWCIQNCAVRSLESLAARLPVSHDRTAQNNSISVSTSIPFTPSPQWLIFQAGGSLCQTMKTQK